MYAIIEILLYKSNFLLYNGCALCWNYFIMNEIIKKMLPNHISENSLEL